MLKLKVHKTSYEKKIFKKWILFFFWSSLRYDRSGSRAKWIPTAVIHCTSINFEKKNQVHYLYLHYFSLVNIPYRKLHIAGCIKGRRIIFGKLKSGDIITTVAASNQISESVSCFDVTSLRVIHCVHGRMNYTGFYRFLEESQIKNVNILKINYCWFHETDKITLRMHQSKRRKQKLTSGDCFKG